MPEGAALSWSFSDIVIRRKGRLAFRYRVPGCSLLDQWPEAGAERPVAQFDYGDRFCPTSDLRAYDFGRLGRVES